MAKDLYLYDAFHRENSRKIDDSSLVLGLRLCLMQSWNESSAVLQNLNESPTFHRARAKALCSRRTEALSLQSVERIGCSAKKYDIDNSIRTRDSYFDVSLSTICPHWQRGSSTVESKNLTRRIIGVLLHLDGEKSNYILATFRRYKSRLFISGTQNKKLLLLVRLVHVRDTFH